MVFIPGSLSIYYSLAKSSDVRSWSYGLVRNPASHSCDNWNEARGTLYDQAIFGPQLDYECACGQYSDRPELKSVKDKMVCDICGVMFTSSASRRQRMGHLDLGAELTFVLGEGEEVALDVLPILPAKFWQVSHSGEKLREIYERFVAAVCDDRTDLLEPLATDLVALLSPVVLAAVEWDLEESSTLARGLALIRKDDQSDTNPKAVH